MSIWNWQSTNKEIRGCLQQRASQRNLEIRKVKHVELLEKSSSTKKKFWMDNWWFQKNKVKSCQVWRLTFDCFTNFNQMLLFFFCYQVYEISIKYYAWTVLISQKETAYLSECLQPYALDQLFEPSSKSTQKLPSTQAQVSKKWQQAV